MESHRCVGSSWKQSYILQRSEAAPDLRAAAESRCNSNVKAGLKG